ncbi:MULTISPECIES: hypothetical protein [Gammaproteobacteria]|uniref:hypothetical protein n=1 Tax=Gammaproteobacteria TaxID=1236 RepID=UPI003A8D76E1
MTIDEADLAKARAAWDAAIQREQEAAAEWAQLSSLRPELVRFRQRLQKALGSLSPDARTQIEQTAESMMGCSSPNSFLKTIEETIIAMTGEPGRLPVGDTGVSMAALKAVAWELDLHTYGSGSGTTPLPDERALFSVCKQFDERVSWANVRSALQAAPRK